MDEETVMIYETDLLSDEISDIDELDVYPCPYCCELECPSDCLTYVGNGRGWIYDSPFREDSYDVC